MVVQPRFSLEDMEESTIALYRSAGGVMAVIANFMTNVEEGQKTWTRDELVEATGYSHKEVKAALERMEGPLVVKVPGGYLAGAMMHRMRKDVLGG